MKIAAEEFRRILLKHGFTESGPAAQDALEHLIQQWVATLVANMSQVAPHGKISRRHFTALEKTLGPMIGALEKSSVQSGGDYWQAAEYYGGQSGSYHASTGHVHTAAATGALARQGISQSGGAARSRALLSVSSTDKFLRASGRTFTDGATHVVRGMLNIMIESKLQHLRKRFPAQHRLTVLMLSLAV